MPDSGDGYLPLKALAASTEPAMPSPTLCDVRLSPIERLLVAALVSAIVKELQAAQPPLRQPAA